MREKYSMDEIVEKKICVVGGTRNRDRISSLPDFILHHIFSFLDIKFAVQTSVLSKRWRNVWTTMPDLKFSFSFEDYVEEHYGDALTKLRDQKKIEFSNLIEKVLNGWYGYEIKKFVLVCDIALEPSVIKSILCRIVRYRVREIEISPATVRDIQFPQCLYASETLEKLKLVTPLNRMVFPTTMGFRALQELRLYGFSFSSKHHYEEIFPRCPILEFLSLVNCTFGGNLVTISAPRLKKIEILYPPPNSSSKSPEFYKVKVCAPMLSYFKFEGPEPMICLMDATTASLEEVEIDIQADLGETEDYKRYHRNAFYTDVDIADGISYRKECRVKRLLDMLKEFRSAKSVIISLKTIEVLSDIPKLLEGQASPFSNLKNIKLKTGWPVLSAWNFLLKESPDAKASLQGFFARLTSGSCKCNCKN